MPLRGTYANQLNDPLVVAVTNNTFTGPQNLIKTAAAYSSQPCIIPVNYLKPGTTIRTEAFGTFSTTATPTLAFGAYYGPTPLGTNLAIAMPSGAVTLDWHLRTSTIVRNATVPTAVVTVTQGELWYGLTLSTITQVPVPGVALATVNVDNSAAAEWSVQATYGTSAAGNIVVLHSLVIEEVTQI